MSLLLLFRPRGESVAAPAASDAILSGPPVLDRGFVTDTLDSLSLTLDGIGVRGKGRHKDQWLDPLYGHGSRRQ